MCGVDTDPAHPVHQFQLYLGPLNSLLCCAFCLNLYQNLPFGLILCNFVKLFWLLCNTVFQLCPFSASQFPHTENVGNVSPLCHSSERLGGLGTARERSVKNSLHLPL